MGTKAINILLVQPKMNWHHPYCETPSRALLILGTLAKGHNVKILHLDIECEDFGGFVGEFKPDIVGFTVNTFQVKNARYNAQEVRAESKDIKIVIGGPHAPVWDGEADEIVVGEGEDRWLEILGEKPTEIPIPDYSLVDMDRFCGVTPVGQSPSTAIMASRGCPYKCTFCNTPLFWGKKVRYREPKLVLEEIALLYGKYDIKEIFFQDDTFNLNHEWASEILEGIIRAGWNKEMLFRITGRVNEKLVTKEFLDLAFRASVWNIFYGIESGSQVMLDRMKKGITVEEIKRAVKMTHEADITTQCSFIIGLPGETVETLTETQTLISEIKPSMTGWCHACPFPLTEFDKEVTENGHKLDVDYADYAYGKVMVKTDALSFEKLASFPGFNGR